RGLGAPATQLVITQTASELRIVSVTDQDKETAVYRLDGSETTISGQAGDIKAKAMLDAGTIAISTSQSFDGPAGEVTIEGKDVYSVDGNTLTIERTINTPFGANRRKLVYTMR
ncbi:MAG: hypothetical protein HY701_08240, partial [Gemmatimonadetes bacterium]|nr:hypothetical protein [Gemmatimonadota bacterium]